MSRCFPYPPPGYTLSRTSKEALIESIKLQKEREKAKEQRKKRKEKKEKRKEKKEKRKEKKVETNQNLDKYDIPKVQIGKSILTNSEQLEKSSLTEEHEQPICFRLPSSSSESTENSNKRKRQPSSIDGNSGYCNIIRIRVPSKKNVSDASINEQQLCSTSGRTDIPAQDKDEISLRNRHKNFCCPSEETSNVGQGFALRTDKKLICSTSGKNDANSPGKTGTPSVPDAVTSSIQRHTLLYKDLIENWVPPLQHYTCFDPDDIDWLFHGKNQGAPIQKRQKSEKCSISCSSSSSLWQPRAQYLPEVAVYALPYSVPF